MKTKKLNRPGAIALATAISLLAAASSSWARSPTKTNDDWTWKYLGEIENPAQMFPGTRLVKFRDTTSGVVCYVYANLYADSRNITTDGKTQDGVAGDQLGTMSCVLERR